MAEIGGRRLVNGDSFIITCRLSVTVTEMLGVAGARGVAQMTQSLKHTGTDCLPRSMMFSKGIASLLILSLVAAYATPNQQSWSASTLRVPVILGVMSRCPDALLCETLFDNVIPRVAEKINLSLAYIAK